MSQVPLLCRAEQSKWTCKGCERMASGGELSDLNEYKKRNDHACSTEPSSCSSILRPSTAASVPFLSAAFRARPVAPIDVICRLASAHRQQPRSADRYIVGSWRPSLDSKARHKQRTMGNLHSLENRSAGLSRAELERMERR